MEYKINPTKRLVRIDFERREVVIDAPALSALIRHLGDARAQMQPAVPEHLDTANPPTPCGTTSIHVLRDDADQVVILGIRHHAYGWIAWAFEDQDARRLAEMLVEAATPRGAIPRH